MKIFYLLLFIFVSFSSLAVKFNVIGGQEIADWPSSSEGLENFTIPNEYHTHLFSQAVKNREGVLIGVGTFRNLILFTMGNFSHLLLIDYDQRIVDFNREHLAFIQKLREQYGDFESQVKEYQKEYGKYLAVFSELGKPYYWQDQSSWEKIVKAINEGRVFAGKGDLFEAEKNAPIIKALNDDKELRLLPRTFDVSNVLGALLNVKGKNFSATLKAFSLSPVKDLIVFTDMSPLKGVVGIENPILAGKGDTDMWYYYYAPLSSYLIFLEQSIEKDISNQEKSLELF